MKTEFSQRNAAPPFPPRGENFPLALMYFALCILTCLAQDISLLQASLLFALRERSAFHLHQHSSSAIACIAHSARMCPLTNFPNSHRAIFRRKWSSFPNLSGVKLDVAAPEALSPPRAMRLYILVDGFLGRFCEKEKNITKSKRGGKWKEKKRHVERRKSQKNRVNCSFFRNQYLHFRFHLL